MIHDDLVAWLDGECDDAQANAIEQALEQDAELRAHLAALVRQRLMLAEVCATHQAGSGVRPASRSASSRRLRAAVRLPSRHRPLLWLAAAAGVPPMGQRNLSCSGRCRHPPCAAMTKRPILPRQL